MRRLLVDLALLATLATILFALAVALRWTSTEQAVDVYLIALGGLAMLGLVHATRDAAPARRRSAFEAALRPPPDPQPSLPTLEKTYRETVLGIARAFDFHVRLRPVLREIAIQRLSARRGVDLDTHPDAAVLALGDEAYELLRPGRLPPERRFDPGVDVDALHRVLDAIEQI